MFRPVWCDVYHDRCNPELIYCPVHSVGTSAVGEKRVIPKREFVPDTFVADDSFLQNSLHTILSTIQSDGAQRNYATPQRKTDSYSPYASCIPQPRTSQLRTANVYIGNLPYEEDISEDDLYLWLKEKLLHVENTNRVNIKVYKFVKKMPKHFAFAYFTCVGESSEPLLQAMHTCDMQLFRGRRLRLCSQDL